MGRKDRGRRTAYRAAVIFLAVCAACLLAGTVNQRWKEGIGKQALGLMEEVMISFWCPALSFAAGPSEGGILGRLFGQFPVLQFLITQEIRKSLLELAAGGNLPEEKLDAPETSGGRVEVDETMQDLLDLENGRTGQKQESREEGQEGKKEGTGAGQTEKQEEYRWEFYETYDALLEEFYAVDATTAADETLLNLDALLGKGKLRLGPALLRRQGEAQRLRPDHRAQTGLLLLPLFPEQVPHAAITAGQILLFQIPYGHQGFFFNHPRFS